MENNTYQIPVWDTIGNAWRKVHGSKAIVVQAYAVIFAIAIGFIIVEYMAKALIPIPGIDGVIKFINQFVSYLLYAGTLYIGIKRAFDLPIEYQLIFRGFETNMAIRMIFLYLIQLLIYTPVIVLIFSSSILFAWLSQISGAALGVIALVAALFLVLYISIRMSLATAFILDMSVNAWDAIKMSFRATRNNFWRLIAIHLILFLILAISAIPLAIGLLWTLPLSLITYGMIYKSLMANIRR